MERTNRKRPERPKQRAAAQPESRLLYAARMVEAKISAAVAEDQRVNAGRCVCIGSFIHCLHSFNFKFVAAEVVPERS